jgi:hypothetical protein
MQLVSKTDVFDTKRMPFKKQVYAGGGDLEIAWVEGVSVELHRERTIVKEAGSPLGRIPTFR